MSDIFGGIFDGISSLFDSGNINYRGLANSLMQVGKDSTDTSGYSALSLAERLSQGKRETPINTGFQATPGKPVESLNADAVEQRWMQRLNKFAEINAATGVKGPK
jgi:hypothetical protein